MNRTNLAAKSSIIGLASKIIGCLLGFISRKFFLDYLGSDLLGVSGTLVQVLETLSVSELGFQVSIIVQLYKPIVENDRDKISAIMSLLRKVYHIIGTVILCLGILCLPFLERIITNVDVNFDLIRTVYLVMLVGTVGSYFMSYSSAMLQADQKSYVVDSISSISNICVSILKILVIVIYKNFVLYTAIGAIGGLFVNGLCYAYYRKHYCWIKQGAKCSRDLVIKIFRDTRDVFIGRVAGYVYNSTDNLVISSVIGTGVVGFVGNYLVITNAMKMFLFGMIAPIQPMVGNYLVSHTKDEAEKILKKYDFILFAFIVVLLIPTMCLSDMFVKIFFGVKYVLQTEIACLLVSDLIVLCLCGGVGMMIDVLGYFRQQRWMFVMYALLNLGLSYFGAKIWGVTAVFVATVLSQVVAWFWRSCIAYGYYFQDWAKWRRYWLSKLGYIVYISCSTILMYYLIHIVDFSNGLKGFVLAGMFCEIVLIAVFVLFFHRQEEFNYMLLIVDSVIRKMGGIIG